MTSVSQCLSIHTKIPRMKRRSISSPVSQETLVSANKSVIQFPTCRILYRGLVESEFMGRAEFVCLERLGRGGDKVEWGGGHKPASKRRKLF